MKLPWTPTDQPLSFLNWVTPEVDHRLEPAISGISGSLGISGISGILGSLGSLAHRGERLLDFATGFPAKVALS